MKVAGFQRDQRANRAVGVDEVAAHQPRLVGDPVGLGVKAAARDPDERPARRPRRGRALRTWPSREHLARRAGLERDPEPAREVVAPAAGQHAQHAVAVAQSRRPQRRPVRRRRTRPRPRRRRAPPAPSSPACVEAARVLDVVVVAVSQRRACSTSGSARVARPPPADGLTISESFTAPRATMEIVRDRHRGRVRCCLGLCAGAHARQHDRAVEPGRGSARQIGVEAVADDQRAAGPEPVERGFEHVRRRACPRSARRARSRTRARPRSRRSPARCRPRSGTCGRGRRRSSRAPASTAWVASRSSPKCSSSWPATTTTSAAVA